MLTVVTAVINQWRSGVIFSWRSIQSDVSSRENVLIHFLYWLHLTEPEMAAAFKPTGRWFGLQTP